MNGLQKALEEHRMQQRLSVLREIQIKLDWLISATPTSAAREHLTVANISLNMASCEKEFVK